jgi:hypothetical protein
MGDTLAKEGEVDSEPEEVLDEDAGMGDKDKPAMTGESMTAAAVLCGQVTRGMSSHRGKDRTDTRTDDVLPTLAEGKRCSSG